MSSRRAWPMDDRRGSRRLTLAAHFDAFRAAPSAYLAAMWWRLAGKKLRARSRLSPLLGRSPWAYRLWVMQRESAPQSIRISQQRPPIVALVDATHGDSRLDDTMRSLEMEGLPALIVGKDGLAPADLGGSIDWRTGPWLMPLLAGDVLAAGAPDSYTTAFAGSPAQLAYADDDLLNERGERTSPHF
ncbi:MAG TPA: glycosyl transferase, partial [Sphingomicrobium sp.]|nr:glycosyl transferase [Sphingomicrobium sp.]